MTAVAIIIGIWAILFIIAFAFVPLWRRHHDAVAGLYARTQDDNKLSLNHAMQELNCKIVWTRDHEDLVARYTFQGGHFGLRLEKNSPYVRLTYPFFFDAELEYIELVRNVCNHCNLNTETSKVVYTVNEEQGVADVHITSRLLISDSTVRDVMERAMENIFRWQRTFSARYDELKKSSGKVPDHDPEKSEAQQARELFLVREQEMMHQKEGPEWHEGPVAPVRLRHLLSVAMGLTDIVPSGLTLTLGDTVSTVDAPDAILDYEVCAPLIAGGRFVRPWAMARLDFYDPRHPLYMRHLTIDFEQERAASDTLYYRVSMTIVPLSKGLSDMPDDLERRRLTASVLLGHDLGDGLRRQEEFRYLWKEAMAKQKGGQTEQLTDDERMLVTLQSANYGMAMLRGRALFLEQRYYEAVQLLENVFSHLQSSLERLGVAGQGVFMELCYLIGACYNGLQQYKLAAYYLQLTLPARRVKYTKAFINSLVGGDDFRAMSFVDSFLHELQPVVGEGLHGEVPDELADTAGFVSFLKRRKAFLLLRLERYDEAESLLKQMLDDPQSSDYALSQLAYIQKKKQRQ